MGQSQSEHRTSQHSNVSKASSQSSKSKLRRARRSPSLKSSLKSHAGKSGRGQFGGSPELEKALRQSKIKAEKPKKFNSNIKRRKKKRKKKRKESGDGIDYCRWDDTLTYDDLFNPHGDD